MNAWPVCIYVCTTWVSGAHTGHKSTSDALELELQTVVRSHAGAENERALGKLPVLLTAEPFLQLML